MFVRLRVYKSTRSLKQFILHQLVFSLYSAPSLRICDFTGKRSAVMIPFAPFDADKELARTAVPVPSDLCCDSATRNTAVYQYFHLFACKCKRTKQKNLRARVSMNESTFHWHRLQISKYLSIYRRS